MNSRLGLGITMSVRHHVVRVRFHRCRTGELPLACSSGNALIIIAWIARTFLQLVTLPVIIVGQNVEAAAADERAEDTCNDADAVRHETLAIQKHLEAQDEVI